MRRAHARGLTLLEVLVSVGVLAMVATLIYGAFDGMQRSRVGLSRIDDRYHQGRQALTRMSRELQSAFLSLHTPLQIVTARAGEVRRRRLGLRDLRRGRGHEYGGECRDQRSSHCHRAHHWQLVRLARGLVSDILFPCQS